MKDPRSLALVWAKEELDSQKKLFGEDPWPYNIEDNRKVLETAIRYEFEQGMINRQMPIEDLFFASSLQKIQDYV